MATDWTATMQKLTRQGVLDLGGNNKLGTQGQIVNLCGKAGVSHRWKFDQTVENGFFWSDRYQCENCPAKKDVPEAEPAPQ